MQLFADIRNPALLVLKGALFAVLALLAAMHLFVGNPSWETALVLLVCQWSACRSYYFVFYVITAYIDPRHRHAGVLSSLRHLLRESRTRPSHRPGV
ncbi:MAG: hypothetical protein AB2A00_38455 [Myxococcota bacterium]